MRRYLAQCSACESYFERFYSIEEHEALKRDKTSGSKIMGECDNCSGQVLQVLITPPEVIFGHEYKLKMPGFNIADGVRTPKQQQEVYAKMIGAKREQAKRTRELRKGSPRQDFEMRHIGSMPIEMDVAVRREHGKRIMEHDPVKMLKRTGCHFGDD